MNRVMQILEQGIDGASRRQNHISNNIANADTPGYKRQDIDFKSALRKVVEPGHNLSLSRTRNNHLAGKENHHSGHNYFKERNTSFRVDGGNVDIEREMAEMAKNNVYFDTLAQQLDAGFNRIHSVLDRSGG